MSDKGWSPLAYFVVICTIIGIILLILSQTIDNDDVSLSFVIAGPILILPAIIGAVRLYWND